MTKVRKISHKFRTESLNELEKELREVRFRPKKEALKLAMLAGWGSGFKIKKKELFGGDVPYPNAKSAFLAAAKALKASHSTTHE